MPRKRPRSAVVSSALLKTPNLEHRASLLTPRSKRSAPFTQVLSSQQGLAVIPPHKVGIRPPPFALRDHKANEKPPPKPIPAPKKKNSKKKLTDVLGSTRFQDGIRFVQAGLPELGKRR